MVFYLFVYHNVARKSRKVGQVRLSNGKVVKNVKDVNGLMQQKAMPIAGVKFEGWLASRSSVEEQSHPLLNDESLAEMLARVSKEQEKTSSKQQPRRRSSSSKKKGSSSYKPPKDPRFQFASESDIAEPEEPPPMATVTVGSPSNSSSASRGCGCMRVRTLQESLSSCNGVAAEKQQLDAQSSMQSDNKTGTTASCSSSTSSVHFGTVEIRQYLCCLGDNPACSSGPPITLDWKYSTVGAYPVDEYVDSHDEAIQISYYDRVELLRRLGYSRSEMMVAEKQRKKDQARREETIYRLEHMARDEKTERVKRRFKRVLRI